MTLMVDKGKNTKQQILETALLMATATSLNDLTIGGLAVATGLSKSGLFAHFKSKENLQLAVLNHAHSLFRDIVIEPTLNIEDPLSRLVMICERWLDWYESQAKTCIYISAAVEFDDQEGPVHEKISRDLAMWLGYLTSTVEQAIKANKLKEDTDPKQFVYELYSLYLGTQSMVWVGIEDECHSRFKQAFHSLIERYSA